MRSHTYNLLLNYPQTSKTMNIFVKKSNSGGSFDMALTNDKTEYEHNFIYPTEPGAPTGGVFRITFDNTFSNYTKIAEINYDKFVGVHIITGGSSYNDYYGPTNLTINDVNISVYYSEIGGYGTMTYRFALPDDVPLSSNLYIEFPPST